MKNRSQTLTLSLEKTPLEEVVWYKLCEVVQMKRVFDSYRIFSTLLSLEPSLLVGKQVERNPGQVPRFKTDSGFSCTLKYQKGSVITSLNRTGCIYCCIYTGNPVNWL